MIIKEFPRKILETIWDSHENDQQIFVQVDFYDHLTPTENDYVGIGMIIQPTIIRKVIDH